jgi:hypothetical protein
MLLDVFRQESIMRTAVLLLGAGVAVLGGCTTNAARRTAGTPAVVATDPAHPPLGDHCTVQFKRDLLGTHASLPVSPTADAINGASVSIRGKLVAVDQEWIVLEAGDETIWVPRQNVLLLHFYP